MNWKIFADMVSFRTAGESKSCRSTGHIFIPSRESHLRSSRMAPCVSAPVPVRALSAGSCGSNAEGRGRPFELIFAEVDQVPEGALAVRHARGGVHIDARREETLVHTRQDAELVVPLHQ